MKRGLIIVLALLAIAAISTASLQKTVTSPSPSDQLVSAAPVSDPVKTVSLPVAAPKERVREATCDNPVVTVSKKLTEAERNEFLIKAMSKLPSTATPEEAGEFVRQVKVNAPVNKTSQLVYVDDPSLGSPPAANDDLDGKELKKWAQKVNDRGCNRGSGSVHLAAYNTTYQNDSVGWKNCYKTDSFSNYLGGTLAKIRLTSTWYNNGFMLPQYPGGYASATAYLGWSKNGNLTQRFTQPYAWYPWGAVYQYQNEAWQDFLMQVNLGWTTVTLDDGSLYINHVFGPGGRCL